MRPGSIYSFKVFAVNAIGRSPPSSDLQVMAAGVPDTPKDFANDPSLTDHKQVGLTWASGAGNGGSQLLDFKISYAEETSSVYTLFVEGI